jgi:hypothetical protein
VKARLTTDASHSQPFPFGIGPTAEVPADIDPGHASADQPPDERVRLLAARCRTVLGDLTLLWKPPGYPGSLALCVLDAIWSMGVRYTAVEHVISRYREHRRGQGADPEHDSTADLLVAIDRAGSPEGLVKLLGNHQRTATRNGVLKADAVAIAAHTLARQEINQPEDLRVAIAGDQGTEVEAGWRMVPGQRSGISWAYLLLLAGVPRVKPDRMIRRFVADALQVADISPQAAARLVTAVQQATPGVSLIALDHAIWQYQRGLRGPGRPATARPSRALDRRGLREVNPSRRSREGR